MISQIRSIVTQSLEEVYGKALSKDVNFDILVPPKPDFGDYSVNVAMVLAKTVKKNPLEIAQELSRNLEKEEVFEKVEVAPPGYINIFLSKKYQELCVKNILENPKYIPFDKKKEKILVEFISANPTGPIHLGNARGGPAGDTLSRILEVLGYSVHKEYYVNDYGKQVEVLGHSILKDKEAQYAGVYIDKLLEEKPKHLTDAREVGKWASQRILETHIQPTCEKLDIIFDEFFSERSLHTEGRVEEMLAILREKDLVYEKEGASWYRSSKFGDDKDRVVVRGDGNPTYRLADFAYHKDKFDRGYDKLITFLGADHLSEAREIKAFIENVLGKSGSYEAILTQFVRVIRDGKEVKMSKRKGTYFALDDLVEEVGRDAVRFIFLSYSNNSHITFDIDLTKQQNEKNPVYSVQYAHARIASILRKAQDISFESQDISLCDHPKERDLMMMLIRFWDVLEHIGTSYETHRLPQYVRELADTFHSFYAECRVIDEKNPKTTKARLALSQATQNTIARALNLCGVSAPEKM
jgi:arginyl-tRNA synthetase